MTVSIVGAGMAGLLAGAMFRGQAQIYEAAESLPNNHHALLRFRSDEIAQHLNIPFQKVEVLKIVKPFRNKVAEAIGYSMKSNGRASLRSIKTAEGRIDQRFIAPKDFIQQLEGMQSSRIMYGTRCDKAWFQGYSKFGPIISTMPMGTLMDILEYPQRSSFGYRHGWVIKAQLELPSDLCATIYYPDPKSPIIRATLTGDLLQVELVEEIERWSSEADRSAFVRGVMSEVLHDFGLLGTKYEAELVAQRYAKIVALPERERKKFIMWCTDEYGIYSVGRFAIWKPHVLLDDVFHDIHKVMAMIRNGNNYEGRL